MRIIAFNGSYGSGKSTAIEILKDWTQDQQLVLVKFAQPLYDIQTFAYDRIVDTYQKPNGFVKDRKLLQWLGTEWGRGLDENLWVNIWKDTAKGRLAYARTIVVCDDCRFDNEAVAVKSMGGVVVKIQRHDSASHAVGGTGIANHASESGISNQYVDYIVENNGTLDEFKESLATLYGQLDVAGTNRVEEHA